MQGMSSIVVAGVVTAVGTLIGGIVLFHYQREVSRQSPAAAAPSPVAIPVPVPDLHPMSPSVPSPEVMPAAAAEVADPQDPERTPTRTPAQPPVSTDLGQAADERPPPGAKPPVLRTAPAPTIDRGVVGVLVQERAASGQREAPELTAHVISAVKAAGVRARVAGSAAEANGAELTLIVRSSVEEMAGEAVIGHEVESRIVRVALTIQAELRDGTDATTIDSWHSRAVASHRSLAEAYQGALGKIGSDLESAVVRMVSAKRKTP